MHRFEGAGERPTPVAEIKRLVEILLLVPGQRAAQFRRQVATVFVQCVGGDLGMIDHILQAHSAQATLQQTEPDNPILAFGDAAGAPSAEITPLMQQLSQFLERTIAQQMQSTLAINRQETLAIVAQHFHVVEMTRGRGGAMHAEHCELFAIGRPIPLSEDFFDAEPGLPTSKFLTEILLAEDQSLVRRLNPVFSAEVKKTKIADCAASGEKPWIHLQQAMWRLYYTEQDRDLMLAVWQTPEMQARFESMKSDYSSAGPIRARDRRIRPGPYSFVPLDQQLQRLARPNSEP
jgi:hypothetical protein